MARILFLQKLWTENLGPMYLSANLKQAGHETRLRIGEDFPSAGELRAAAPDLIAFSITTGIHLWALACARHIKRLLDRPVILGGAHPTYFPEVIENDGVDIICRGEGEDAIIELAAQLDSGKEIGAIRNLWFKRDGEIVRNALRPLIRDLDRLPPPDRNLYYQSYPFLRDNPTKNFISGRGCPYSCAYCATATLRTIYRGLGPFTRFRNPAAVIDEIADVKQRYGLRTACFQDDTFILQPSRLPGFLENLQARTGIAFICHIRADLVNDCVLALLKRTGCHSVDFGLESGNPMLRREILKKTVSNQQIEYAAMLLHRHRIPFRTTNMLGLPGETLDQAWETIRLNQLIRTPYPTCSVYQPYPKTELGDQVIAAGLVGKDYGVDSIGSTFYKGSVLDTREGRLFTNLQKFFLPAIRFPRLAPLIHRLIKLPPNPLFDLVFLTGYAYTYMGSENIGLGRVFRLGRRTFRSFFYGMGERLRKASRGEQTE